ncbi:MAG: 1-deoxy-D-xylulose-5-phosphate reductoisomerase [Candidatus Omnitrophica bacterium]|nr:1-deoxy-D-xylulose-5-phosphate reductoisomerase [Candidatus Omnitrophota bacterium]
MKKVLIFGSTGSIGKNALSVMKTATRKFKVLGLCANSDIKTLLFQIKEYCPRYVCVVDEKQASILAKSLDKRITLFRGQVGLEEFSTINSDISIMGISGIAALKSLMINLKHTKKIALANKESIVVGGSFVLNKAKRCKTEIIPVDSEINSLFQLFSINDKHLNKVYLTASGGSLINYKKKELAKVSAKEVLAHPTWKMGPRVTVDSATLVNKGFEVIETHCFFDIPYEDIDIIIHRQSTVHAMIEFKDSALFACIYPPDMKMPIAYALYHPARSPHAGGTGLGLKFSLSFEPLDYKQFPSIKIILEAAKRGGNSLAVLNACDEVAVEYFLRDKIKFTHIHKILERMFSKMPQASLKSVDDVFFWDKWARQKTNEYIKSGLTN